MRIKPKFTADSKEEFEELEKIYKDFTDKYIIEFKGNGDLLIKKSCEKSEIEIILQENWGENELNIFDKSKKELLISVFPYSGFGHVLKVNDKVYTFKHEAYHKKPTERFHPSYWFPGSKGQW